ncbi:glycosyltransferase family protein [Nitratifractor sp.]
MIPLKRFCCGSTKILAHVYGDLAMEINLRKIAQYNRINLLTLIDVRKNLFGNTELYNVEWGPEEQEKYGKHRLLMRLYEIILEIVREEKVNIFLWLGDPGIFSKDFLQILRQYCYTAFWTFDDPVNSEKIVKHIAAYYHQGFTAAVNWDRERKVSDVFKTWGVPRATFIPIGVYEGKYVPGVNFSQRPYDLIFVGSVFQKRLLFLFRLKKYFGNRMLIFGHGWNGEGQTFYKRVILQILKWYYKVPKISSINNEELIKYYQLSKIGVNTHMTDGGPSAVRTYELPVNGVMQVCDSQEGLSEIFTLDQEVVAYRNNDARDAIMKIEYFLSHEEQRISIAKKGFEKARREYMVWHSFEKILNAIYRDPVNRKYI